MNTSLELLKGDLAKSGIESVKIRTLWKDQLFIAFGDYVVRITKNSSWYFLEYRAGDRLIVKLKVRILEKTNCDTVELIKLVRELSAYTIS